MQMLSPNFSLEELTRSDTAARLGIDNSPPGWALENLRVLCALLEFVRKGLALPLVVSSGYRCRALNLKIPGSALSSAHTFGFAADFHVEGLEPFELCTRVLELLHAPGAMKFDQLILEYDSWCHLSADPKGRGQVLTKRSGSPYEEGLVPRKETGV